VNNRIIKVLTTFVFGIGTGLHVYVQMTPGIQVIGAVISGLLMGVGILSFFIED